MKTIMESEHSKVKKVVWAARALALFVLTVGLLCSPAHSSESEKITITDQAGRTVHIPAKINRIVSLWPEATRTIFALGEQNKIVGIDGSMKADPIFTELFPQMIRRLPATGRMMDAVNTEELVKLKPDIIFGDARRADMADSLQKRTAIPVVCVRINPPALKGKFSFELISLIGRILNKQERANYLLQFLQDKLSKITTFTDRLPPKNRCRGIIVSAMVPGAISANGDPDPLNAAGVINVAIKNKEVWYQLNPEQVMIWKPEIVFVHILSKMKVQDLLADSQWQKVPAVKNRRVYNVIIGWCGWYPSTTVINIMQIAKTAYPEYFRNLDIEKQGNEIFRVMYGADNFFTHLIGKYDIYIP